MLNKQYVQFVENSPMCAVLDEVLGRKIPRKCVKSVR
jgi:hypothetical protein